MTRQNGFLARKLRIGETLYKSSKEFPEEFTISGIVSLRYDTETYHRFRKNDVAAQERFSHDVCVPFDLDEDNVLVYAKRKEERPRAISNADMLKLGFGMCL